MKLFKDDAKFVAQDRLRLRNSLRESVSSLHHICMCSLVRRVNLCVRSLDCYEFQASSTQSSHRDDCARSKIS